MSQKIKHCRAFARGALVLGFLSFITAIFLAVMGKYLPAVSCILFFLCSIPLSSYARAYANELEKKRIELWKQKFRTVEYIRPLIYERCNAILLKERDKILIDPLLEFGPGPYTDEYLNSVMWTHGETGLHSYFRLVNADLLWSEVGHKTTHWSDRLWEVVDQQSPPVPDSWSPMKN